jgi:hypothetical protein
MIKIFHLLCLISISTSAFGRSLDERVTSAVRNCLKPNRSNLEVFYTKAPSDMIRYYTPSTAQKVMFPVYRSIFDRFGSSVQAAFSNDEQVHAEGYLKYLGDLLNQKRLKEGLSDHQTICLASCLTNHLMTPDVDVTPTTSMLRSVTIGRGFCRHFVQSTEMILRPSLVKTQFGMSFEHIFMYTKHKGKKVIFDPMNNESVYACEFFGYIP